MREKPRIRSHGESKINWSCRSTAQDIYERGKIEKNKIKSYHKRRNLPTTHFGNCIRNVHINHQLFDMQRFWWLIYLSYLVKTSPNTIGVPPACGCFSSYHLRQSWWWWNCFTGVHIVRTVLSFGIEVVSDYVADLLILLSFYFSHVSRCRQAFTSISQYSGINQSINNRFNSQKIPGSPCLIWDFILLVKVELKNEKQSYRQKSFFNKR